MEEREIPYIHYMPLWFRGWFWQEKWNRYRDNTLSWIAQRIPRKLVYWCVIRVWAEVTIRENSPYPNQVLIIDALRKWEA